MPSWRAVNRSVEATARARNSESARGGEVVTLQRMLVVALLLAASTPFDEAMAKAVGYYNDAEWDASLKELTPRRALRRR